MQCFLFPRVEEEHGKMLCIVNQVIGLCSLIPFSQRVSTASGSQVFLNICYLRSFFVMWEGGGGEARLNLHLTHAKNMFCYFITVLPLRWLVES